MPALILGLGYLGAALAARLLARGDTVVGLDNGFATDWPALERLAARADGRLRLIGGDVRDAAAVDGAFAAARPIEVVFLLAAQASAHPAAAPPEYTEETNLRGPRVVFDAAVRHGSPPVVYASSFHIYGGSLAGQVDERRPYGAVRDLAHLSKIYAEKLGEMYATVHGLPVAPVRLGVVYGLGPVTKRDLRFVTVPHAFCLRALAGSPLEVHPSGTGPIAFVHLEDAVEALRLAGSSAARGGRHQWRGPLVAAPLAGSGYAPANAAAEVATALDVARYVTRAAAAIGLDVPVHVRSPGAGAPSPTRVPASGSARGAPQEPAPLVAGPITPDGAATRLPAGETGPAFRPVSRLAAAGWRPRPRLAGTVPQILEYYASGGAAA